MAKVEIAPVRIVIKELLIGAGDPLVAEGQGVRFRTVVTPAYDGARSEQQLVPAEGWLPVRQSKSGWVADGGVQIFEGHVCLGEDLVVDVVPQMADERTRGDQARRLRGVLRGDPRDWEGSRTLETESMPEQPGGGISWTLIVDIGVGQAKVGEAPLWGEHVDHRLLADEESLARTGPLPTPDVLAAALRGTRDPELRLTIARPPEWVGSRDAAAVIQVDKVGLTGLIEADNPAPHVSMGYASATWATPERKRGRSAELTLPLVDLGHLQRDTVRVFHWDESSERWGLVGSSGVDEHVDVAWARTSLRGRFVAVGLHRDPAVRQTLQMMADLLPLARQSVAWGDAGRFDQLCHVILCPALDFSGLFHEGQDGHLDFSWVPELEELASELRATDDADWEARGVRRPAGGRPPGPSGLVPGDVCESCLGLPGMAIGVPEFELGTNKADCKRWESLGPTFPSGVIEDIAFHPTRNEVLFVAGQHGGVFRSTDHGRRWLAMTDEIVASTCMGVAVQGVAPAGLEPSTYAVFLTSALGTDFGLYVSQDLGASWQRGAPFQQAAGGVGRTELRCVAGRSTDGLVYVGTTTGLYKSIDAGRSWVGGNVTLDGATKNNFRSLFDGVIHDVVLDPADDDIVWIVVGGLGILVSRDGGASWTNSTVGVPELTISGLIRVDVGQDTAPGRHGGDFVVAKVGNRLAYTDDGGRTWTVLAPPSGSETGGSTQAGWCSAVAIDPTDERRVFAGAIALARTEDITDASPVFSLVPGQDTWADDTSDDTWHADHQSLRFSPHDPRMLFTCNDGGVTRLLADGSQISRLSKGLVACQNLWLDVSQTGPFEIGSSTYHNGIIKKRPGSLVWDMVGGNEGGFYRIDPRKSTTHFKNSWGNGLSRSTSNGDVGTWSAPAGFPMGTAADARARLLEWKPWGAKAIICTASYDSLWISTDDGATFNPVAGPNGDWLQLCGSGLRGDIGTAVAFSQSEPNRILVGSRCGQIWTSGASSTNAANWQRLPSEPLGTAPAQVNGIAVHPANPDVMYVAYARMGTNVYRTEDGGSSWAPANGVGLWQLPGLAVADLYMDPASPQRLFAALAVGGVWETHDGGDWWEPWDQGLPEGGGITEMRLRRSSRTLFAASYGRGIWSRAL